MNECPISPMKSWDLWDVMGQLWDTLNHYSIRLFLICPISPITSTVKGMKSMYEYIVTYMHVKYIKMGKVMGLMGQTPKTRAEQRREVSHKCPMTLLCYGTCGTVMGHLGDSGSFRRMSEPMVHFVRAPFLAKKGVTLVDIS